MIFVFAALAVLAVVAIGFFAVGRETTLLRFRARSAVFELEEAVAFIAEELPVDVASRISRDDVRWILGADVDRLEEATVDSDDPDAATDIVDQDSTVARILQLADEQERDLADEDIVAVLDARTRYLQAIGAIGPEVT